AEAAPVLRGPVVEAHDEPAPGSAVVLEHAERLVHAADDDVDVAVPVEVAEDGRAVAVLLAQPLTGALGRGLDEAFAVALVEERRLAEAPAVPLGDLLGVDVPV